MPRPHNDTSIYELHNEDLLIYKNASIVFVWFVYKEKEKQKY